MRWVRTILLMGLVVVLADALPVRAHAASQKSASARAAQISASKPTSAEIAAAKASGKVWVNLNTGIYHKGGRWYGKTKKGKFMTPEEARKAGYKAAKRD
jgi:hypothetical protein